MARRRAEKSEPMVLIGERRIRARVRELGRRISRDYRGTVPVFIGILNGSFVFLADLVREVTVECEVEFVRLSSYRGRQRGRIRLRMDPELPVRGRDIILVEDVVDSGETIRYLKKRLTRLKPRSVSIAALMVKDHSNGEMPEYTGFVIPRGYVAGYGLDCDGRMRNRREVLNVSPEAD